MLIKSLFVTTLVLLISSCYHLEKKAYYTSPELSVNFLDDGTKWGGQMMPYEERCQQDGGLGNSPALVIEKIPQGSNAVVVEFGDDNDFWMKGAGHGRIGIKVEAGQSEVIIPSIAEGQVDNLPEGVFIDKHAKKNYFFRHASGGYLAPCHGERGHDYYATVKAIYFSDNIVERSIITAIGRIYMGQY